MTWPIIALITLITFWISLIVLLVKWPRSRNMSISQHSAAQKESYIFFTTVQVVAGIVLYFFMIRWFIPTFRIPGLFTAVYSVVAWLQIISAFIPDTVSGRKSYIHQLLANGFALGMFLSALILCFVPAISGLPKIVIYLTTLYLSYGTILAISIRGRPERFHNYLFIQVLYIVSFQISIIFAALYR